MERQEGTMLDVVGVETEVKPLRETVQKEIESTSNRLDRLGFKDAVKEISRQQKLVIAYEKYMFIMEENIVAFNDKLRKETMREDKNSYQFKRLVFIPIEQYGKIPPEHVLDKLESAQKDGCFDRFEICKIDWVKEIKDPIVFGRIDGCPDRFFISQWDDDIKVEDLIFVQK
jgi:hypothetical protein